MKIAFIVSAFPSLSETFILNQITGLLDLGHEVEIIAFQKSPEKKIHQSVEKYQLLEKVSFVDMPAKKSTRLGRAFLLFFKNLPKNPLKILKSLNFFKYGREAYSLRLFYFLLPFLNKKFAIIHAHFGPNGRMAIKLKELGIRARFITTFHGYDANCYPKDAGKDIYLSLFKEGDLFTTNTNFTREQIEKLGCPREKILILPVGLEMGEFDFYERKLEPGERITILTVGRLVEKKGHAYAIKALAKLTKNHPHFEYLIVGDGPLREELKELVFRLKLNDKIKFLGALDQAEIQKIYQQAHLFLLPSITAKNLDREGQALVLQEAQAVGLPIVSTYHNGIPEGVLEGKSAFLVPEKDIAALANKIVYLFDNPGIWGGMGKDGRKFVEKRYDIKKLNQRLVEIYQNLLE